MKINWPWKKKKVSDDVSELEARLENFFESVEPRDEFVTSLRDKLIGGPTFKIFGLEFKKPEAGLAVIGGIVSIILLLVTGIRAILMILGMLGIMKRFNKEADSIS